MNEYFEVTLPIQTIHNIIWPRILNRFDLLQCGGRVCRWCPDHGNDDIVRCDEHTIAALGFAEIVKQLAAKFRLTDPNIHHFETLARISMRGRPLIVNRLRLAQPSPPFGTA